MRHSVVLLALAFVLIQAYVLYASTFHVFHDSMPMCQACVAVKSYHSVTVNNIASVFLSLGFDLVDLFFSPQSLQVVVHFYDSRAPPLSSNLSTTFVS